jgi:tetratricopeptide (TPR) repeat protein
MREMNRTWIALVLLAMPLAAPVRGQGPAQGAADHRTAVQAVFQLSQTAATMEDYTTMIDECQRLMAEPGLAPAHQAYLKQLGSWALNRRGEARSEESAAKAEAGDTEAAAQLDAQSLEDFNLALEWDATRWKAFHNRGVSYAMTHDYDKALADFDQALRLKPTYANTWFNRGEIHYEQGKYAEAIADYNNVLRVNRDDADAYTRRGHAYFKLGRYREALSDYSRAVTLKPDDAMAYLNRGEAYLSLSLWDPAARDYRQAITIDGTMGRAYQGAAWLMAACPDQRYRYPDRAVNAALKAIELAGDEVDYRYYDTLAAAHATAGDFAKAQEVIVTAIENAPEDKAEDLKKRQTMYQQNQAYRIQ